MIALSRFNTSYLKAVEWTGEAIAVYARSNDDDITIVWSTSNEGEWSRNNGAANNAYGYVVYRSEAEGVLGEEISRYATEDLYTATEWYITDQNVSSNTDYYYYTVRLLAQNGNESYSDGQVHGNTNQSGEISSLGPVLYYTRPDGETVYKDDVNQLISSTPIRVILTC